MWKVLHENAGYQGLDQLDSPKEGPEAFLIQAGLHTPYFSFIQEGAWFGILKPAFWGPTYEDIKSRAPQWPSARESLHKAIH